MNRRAIRMLIFAGLILSMALAFNNENAYADEGSYAGSTILSFEIPGSHLVIVKSSNGKVSIYGKTPAYKQSFDIKRFAEQRYVFIPDDGYELAKLIYNGIDVTEQVKYGVWTAPKLEDDANIEAVFDKKVIDSTSDNTVIDDKDIEYIGLTGKIILEGEAVAGALIQLQGNLLKDTLYTHTDKSGKFDFGVIPKGNYYMYVSQDESIDGIICFKIVERNVKILGTMHNFDGQLIIQPSHDTIALYMELVLNGDLTISPYVNYIMDPELDFSKYDNDLIMKKIVINTNNNGINDNDEITDTNVDKIIVKENKSRINKDIGEEIEEICNIYIVKNVKNRNFLFIIVIFFDIIVLTRIYIWTQNEKKCPMGCEHCNRGFCNRVVATRSKT